MIVSLGITRQSIMYHVCGCWLTQVRLEAQALPALQYGDHLARPGTSRGGVQDERQELSTLLRERELVSTCYPLSVHFKETTLSLID